MASSRDVSLAEGGAEGERTAGGAGGGGCGIGSDKRIGCNAQDSSNMVASWRIHSDEEYFREMFGFFLTEKSPFADIYCSGGSHTVHVSFPLLGDRTLIDFYGNKCSGADSKTVPYQVFGRT